MSDTMRNKIYFNKNRNNDKKYKNNKSNFTSDVIDVESDSKDFNHSDIYKKTDDNNQHNQINPNKKEINGFKQMKNMSSQYLNDSNSLNSLNSPYSLIIEHMNLMAQKQNFIMTKFVNFENQIMDSFTKLEKENIELKTILKNMSEDFDNKLSLLLYENEKINEKIDEEYQNYDDNYDTKYEEEYSESDELNKKKCDDPKCSNCNNNDKNDDDDNYDNENKTVKFDGKISQNSEFGRNPLQILVEQLSGTSKNNKKDEEYDKYSDDGYDENVEIYENDDEKKENNNNNENFIEFTDSIKNIRDLLLIAEKYKNLIKKPEKNDKTKKKNKKNKMKLENDEENNEEKKDSDDSLYELDGKKYPINLEIIIKLSEPLSRLSKMIGMEKVKDDIFEMIIYYLQGFENKNNNMLHSVIEGPPGVGKTKLGKILAGVYSALGIIPSNRFKYVKATDLIGDHVGATKHMTQSVIDEANGGVLFIDEAYSLSSNDNKDPYGKECIDTINFNLSENKKKLIVIIAGYPDHLDKYFFSFNPGLERRFPFKFKIDGYTPDELKDIYIDKLRKFGWKFTKSVTMDKLSSFFKTYEKDFPNYGGDVENFFKSCQFAHSKRMIGLHPDQRKKINFDDIKNGLEKFKKNKRNNEPKSEVWKMMYN